MTTTSRRTLLQLATTMAAMAPLALPAQAEIYRWDNGALIAGTTGLWPGPGVDLSSKLLSVANLDNANLQTANLFSTRLYTAHLISADLTFANLTLTDFNSATLTSANLSSANLTSTSFFAANLANANFNGATLNSNNFINAVGLTGAQILSTSNYQTRQLDNLRLPQSLSFIGADLSLQNLTSTTLVAADFTSASLASANLTAASLSRANLTSADFTSADLTRTSLASATFAATNLAGARINGTDLTAVTSRGFTQSMLQSTAGYQQHDLTAIQLVSNTMTGWNFTGQNLTSARFMFSALQSADFSSANLTSAQFSSAFLQSANFTSANLASAWLDVNFTSVNIANANVTGAHFAGATNFTPAQLASTASYQLRDLSSIDFRFANLAGWNFVSQNLTSANFQTASLQFTDFTSANLTSADLRGANLQSANLTDAIVNGANLTSPFNFTPAQLYATASYKIGDLRGVLFGTVAGLDLANQNLSSNNFVGVNFSGTSLAGANIQGANFNNAFNFSAAQLYSTASYQNRSLGSIRLYLFSTDLSLADLRGTVGFSPLSSTIRRGTIHAGGTVLPFTLNSNETFRIRPGIPATATGTITLQSNARITLDPAATLNLPNLTTNSTLTLTFAEASKLNVTADNALTLNGGIILLDPAASLGYHQIIQYAGAIQGAGIDSLTLAPTQNNITYSLDLTASFLTLHKGFLGDANDDGAVTFTDFIALANNFGQPDTTWLQADFNHDHATTFEDFVILANNFGQSITGTSSYNATARELAVLQAFAANSSSIPEPATFSLLTLAALPLLTRRRSRRR